MLKPTKTLIALSCSVFFLCACSGSGSDGADGEDVANLDVASDIAIPKGNINSYGAVTVGDDAGIASDLVASFFSFDTGVSADYLLNAFNPDKTVCSVDDDDNLDFEEFSVGFIPSFKGASKSAISAGNVLSIDGPDTEFAILQTQSAGSYLFYTLPDMQVLPLIAVPQNLQVTIQGDIFPAYSRAKIPDVEPLKEFSYGADANVTAKTVFSWLSSPGSDAMVRIIASTAGGFFLENGVSVSCLVPDTGSFTYPLSVQAKLGANFKGSAPMASRIAINTETKENSVLYLVRESFTE